MQWLLLRPGSCHQRAREPGAEHPRSETRFPTVSHPRRKPRHPGQVIQSQGTTALFLHVRAQRLKMNSELNRIEGEHF
jgi:hypothetical protein